MSTFCCDECKEVGEVCDFCKYFTFSNFWCEYHRREVSPLDGCKEFYCFLLDEEEIS